MTSLMLSQSPLQERLVSARKRPYPQGYGVNLAKGFVFDTNRVLLPRREKPTRDYYKFIF